MQGHDIINKYRIVPRVIVAFSVWAAYRVITFVLEVDVWKDLTMPQTGALTAILGLLGGISGFYFKTGDTK